MTNQSLGKKNLMTTRAYKSYYDVTVF